MRRGVLTVLLAVALLSLSAEALSGKAFRQLSRDRDAAHARLEARWDQAYYKEVHPAVVRMAQKFMTPKALTTAKSLIGANLEAEAGWADRIVFTPPEQKWSSPLHFINLPNWACVYNRARDCVGNVCVDGAIQNYTTRLASPLLAVTQRQEALKFLLHLVGDIHNPLHVGNGDDWGGNKLMGNLLDEKDQRNLHAIWDASIMQRHVQTKYKGNVQAWTTAVQKQATPPNIRKWQTCRNKSTRFGACSEEWANESAALACLAAYKDTKGVKIATGFKLDQAYFNRAVGVIETALIKAAVRLAGVLNKIFA